MELDIKLWFGSVIAVATLLPDSVQADCVFAPTLGNDAYVCDSGTAAQLTDLQGDNSLTLPAGGTGEILGGVSLGPGRDTVLIQSGTIGGTVSQGGGVDDFVMTGGQIQALSQGDSRDTFLMSGGTIVGAFEDGDVARMSGGSIGRVDMKLDNNVFILTGGRILGNLVAGFGSDTVEISGGSIGGNLSVSGGNDNVTLSGGEIGGNALLSQGNDTFTWRGGGVVRGIVSLAGGDDTVLLSGLDDTVLGPTATINGDSGMDTVMLDNTLTASSARFINFERISLSNDSQLDLANQLYLGDVLTEPNTGSLNIDASSTLGADQSIIAAAVTGRRVEVNNAGLIDLTRSGDSASDRLTIVGNYTGDGGRLNLQSVLAGDEAASDRLVVSGGSLSGQTSIRVTNLQGQGALTQVNGIEVVEANRGAVSSESAFTLANNLSVGAYQYYLFKGGVTAGSENSWFLRSSVVAPAAPPMAAPPVVPVPPVLRPVTPPVTPPAEPEPEPVPVPEPEPPVIPPEEPELPAPSEPEVELPAPAPVAPFPPVDPATPGAPATQVPVAAIGSPVLPQARPGQSITLYRIEVPVYSIAPPAAALLALTSLGTFHERQGEQSLLREQGSVAAGWARAYGSHARQQWAGDVAPSFDGNIGGYQVGHDLYAVPGDSGYRQHAGLFVGSARLRGDVKGFALGFEDAAAGDIRLRGDSVGVYWTLIGPGGAYLDAVAMGTRFEGRSRSQRGYALDLDGHGVSLSLETGVPLPVGEHWVIEPQAQIIAQKIALDHAQDPVSKVSFDSQPYWRTRVGARLKGAYAVNGNAVEPYLRVNLWHSLEGQDTVTFDGNDRIKTDHASTLAQLGAGVAVQVSRDISLYLGADYMHNLDSQPQQAVQGTLGLRMSW